MLRSYFIYYLKKRPNCYIIMYTHKCNHFLKGDAKVYGRIRQQKNGL